LLFVYPRYQTQEFQQAVKYEQFKSEIGRRGILVSDKMVVKPKIARDIAEAIWNIKRPIDFRLYQESASGWNLIQERIP
jgi:hypothetical protein